MQLAWCCMLIFLNDAWHLLSHAGPHQIGTLPENARTEGSHQRKRLHTAVWVDVGLQQPVAQQPVALLCQSDLHIAVFVW